MTREVVKQKLDRLSITLIPGKRKKAFAFVYGVLSLLEGVDDLKYSGVIDTTLKISIKYLLDRYKDYIKENREKIVTIMRDKFGINDAEKVFQEIVDGDFLSNF